MSNVTAASPRQVALPRWPGAILAFLACLGTISLMQGVFDIVIPSLTGQQPFGFLFQMTAILGPVFFTLYVFIHNLGLACIVPGFGFAAVWLEKKKHNRKHIATLLSGAVIVGLLVGLEFLLQASDRFDLARVLPLFVIESAGVLLLVVPSARELRTLVPTRTYEWSLLAPLQALAVPLIMSSAVLAAASAYETWLVLHP
ncbi:MAG: hypothetical protein WDA16_06005 [Candidatus Thermoplasmatota archaeon]